MDDDLESELMDLGTNESVYLPQAAHSRPPPVCPPPPPPSTVTASHGPPPPPPPPPAPQRRASSLPASLASSYTGIVAGEPQPLDTAAISALPAAPSLLRPVEESSADGQTAPLDAGEEPAGWYDQLEMVLASAEARYFAWVEDLESRGSATEEAFRQAEAQRVERRRDAVAELKQMRRAVVHAALIESSSDGTAHSTDGVNVDAMMDKLARVVDESAAQLKKLRRSGVWTTLAENLPQTERDYVARSADEMFGEKLKYKREPHETQEIVEQHLKALFQLQPLTRNGQSVGRVMNHSLGQMLREFADIFHACYGDPTVQVALSFRGNGPKAATLILSRVAADINAFAAILVQILLYKYPDVPRTWSSSVVQRCVIDALFEHLQPTLHALYVAAFDAENAFLSRLCQQLRACRLDSFGISPVFRLDGAWASDGAGGSTAMLRDTNDLHLQSLRQYEPVIHRMNALPSHRSPWVKAELVAGVCKDLDARVKAFYAAQGALGHQCPLASATNMNADDLSALLAFLIAASPALCSHLATQLALLGSFMESEVAMGEAGFAVATLWTAVSHLCHLTQQYK